MLILSHIFRKYIRRSPLYFCKSLIYNTGKEDCAMLTYTMDVEPASIWLRTTPGTTAKEQPYFVTEAGLFYGRKHFATSRANKDSYLIFYTIDGEGWLKQGDQEVCLPKGTAVMINCRTPQTYRTSPNSTRWHHFWIHCDGAGVAAMESILNPGGIIRPVPVSSAMRERCERILSLITRDNLESVLEMSLSVHRILTRIAGTRLSGDLPAASAGGTSVEQANRELIERAAEYIRAHFTDDIDIRTLLSVTHLSRAHFLRLFRQYIGDTPHHYLICYRITQAKELLETTDLPIRQIAEQVGFHDESNFSTRFAKIAGETPRQYRSSTMLPQC